MNRLRRLIVASPLALVAHARASTARVPRVVIAQETSPRGVESNRAAFAEEGFVDGRNVRLEYVAIRDAPPPLAEARARAIVASRPDVIVMTFGPETLLLMELTRDIPIVFHNYAFDPARSGLVESVRRPGGNVTGTYHDWDAVVLKTWGLMKEVRPSFKRGAWLVSAGELASRLSNYRKQDREIHALAEKQFGIHITEIAQSDDAPIEQVIGAIRKVRPEAMMTQSFLAPERLDEFLIASGIVSDRLVTVGLDFGEGARHAIAMVARILRGEKPGNIPAYKGTRYPVQLDMKMARAMGIPIPPSILVQATRVRE